MNTVIVAPWAGLGQATATTPAVACEGHPGMSGGVAVEAATAVSDITAAWPRGNGLTAKSWRLYG
jgi:hypothetical protein